MSKWQASGKEKSGRANPCGIPLLCDGIGPQEGI